LAQSLRDRASIGIQDKGAGNGDPGATFPAIWLNEMLLCEVDEDEIDAVDRSILEYRGFNPNGVFR